MAATVEALINLAESLCKADQERFELMLHLVLVGAGSTLAQLMYITFMRWEELCE